MPCEKGDSMNRRGRPRCIASRIMDSMPPELLPDGTARTRVDRVYSLHAASQLQGLLPDHDFMSTGAQGALVEIGRYLMAGRCQPDALLFIQAARQDGAKWTAIKKHFRQLRLGDRHPKGSSLANALLRTIHEYRKQFPKLGAVDIGNAIALVRSQYEQEA